MTPSRISLTFVLLTVLLASACAPAIASPTATDAPALPSEVTVASEVTVTSEPEATLVPTEAAVLPVATSRGPELHATDPTTVALASRGLQLVEFFRFT